MVYVSDSPPKLGLFPSWNISTQFSSAASPGWKAAFGSPAAQFRKPREVLSVQPQPTRKARFHKVAVPSEADPYVVILGVIEVPDELHLRSTVERQQVCLVGLAVVQGVRPGDTLLLVVHKHLAPESDPGVGSALQDGPGHEGLVVAHVDAGQVPSLIPAGRLSRVPDEAVIPVTGVIVPPAGHQVVSGVHPKTSKRRPACPLNSSRRTRMY
ncbi:hypothetical protein F7725_015673 [Dissostichus mawsoni]|uniref:Uncharacterized protein n=1 Tax=Dissostichus mawsoni TaxID=36200 RepID=A0A7J5YI53_DISMA|nr:hypothetical protein F7725_015673 [Dissostichus mawsoni]